MLLTSDALRRELSENNAKVNKLLLRNDAITKELARRGLKACEPSMPMPPLEYTLEEVTKGRKLSDWARFVAVDADGTVWEFEVAPFVAGSAWVCLPMGQRCIGKVVPPFNFENCLFAVQ